MLGLQAGPILLGFIKIEFRAFCVLGIHSTEWCHQPLDLPNIVVIVIILRQGLTYVAQAGLELIM